MAYPFVPTRAPWWRRALRALRRFHYRNRATQPSWWPRSRKPPSGFDRDLFNTPGRRAVILRALERAKAADPPTMSEVWDANPGFAQEAERRIGKFIEFKDLSPEEQARIERHMNLTGKP